MGLSRDSLREAVRAPSPVRIPDVRQGGGTYAAGLDPQPLPEAPGFAVDFHRDDTVPEFPAVRRVLEPAATAVAAAPISGREPDALSEQLDGPGPEPSVKAPAAADPDFHRGVVRGSGNSVLCPSSTPCPAPPSVL